MGIIAFTSMTVKLQFCNIATGICRTNITHITESTGTGDISLRHHANGALFGNDIEWQRIHKILAVGAFKDTQLYALGSQTIITGHPAYLCDDVWRTQVKASPSVVSLIRSEESIRIPVKGFFTAVDSGGLLSIAIVHRFQGAYNSSWKFFVGIGPQRNTCQHSHKK